MGKHCLGVRRTAGSCRSSCAAIWMRNRLEFRAEQWFLNVKMSPDCMESKERSRLMARVRGRDTVPELLVRSLLHRAGVRFSLCSGKLPGKPDLVLRSRHTVIFVHGCFWHRHKSCPFAATPATRTAFWSGKFSENVRRDRRNVADLRRLGWRVLVVWECDAIRDPASLQAKLMKYLGIKKKSGRHLPERSVLIAHMRRRLFNLLGD